ncbi:hypothetical protein RSOLAG1IB_11732 [Rhizoctonia solani AG-1 IB]|uniref:Uncharacterized protein n=1 Tax=Thanatephorus cucumeris (strain AG1-IB / isolate 7/3/14) TaxID=1108050 RepID=A0A0B7FEL8_THACB|nr:hypothetical protein RSOLAG1IB_11732 [Rhizoctonia solani AG-1 IB]
MFNVHSQPQRTHHRPSTRKTELRWTGKLRARMRFALANIIECRSLKSRPESHSKVRHACTTLKDCLSALCRGSTELLADPQRDQLTYALDPLQVPQFIVGPVLVASLVSESGNVVGMVIEDHIDSDELQVLRVPLSLTAILAV